MTDFLFVYGTLRSEESQSVLLAGLARKKATVLGSLWDLPAGYPALCLMGEETVHGELVEGVNPTQLQIIDAYEGVAEGLFRRVRIPVDWGLQRTEAWVYVMDSPHHHGGRPLTSGRWRRTRRR